MPVATEWEHADRYPAEIVETMRSMGLFGIAVPEEYGGLALDMVSFALVFEEISRGWMGLAGILGSHSLSCWMIARYGSEEQKQAYLPELASGQRRTGIALTEPHAGTDLQGICCTARRDGDDYVVSGTKMWITNARHADPLPVLVKTDPTAEPAHKGMSVLLVDASSPGFTVSRDLPKLADMATPAAGRPVAHVLGRDSGGCWGAGGYGVGDGEAPRFRDGALVCPGIDARARQLWLFAGVRRGAALPRRAAHGHRGRHQRGDAYGDRAGAGLGQGLGGLIG